MLPLLEICCIFPVTSQTTLPFSGFWYLKKKTTTNDIEAKFCPPNLLPISAVLVTAHSLAFIGIQSRSRKCSAKCCCQAQTGTSSCFQIYNRQDCAVGARLSDGEGPCRCFTSPVVEVLRISPEFTSRASD